MGPNARGPWTSHIMNARSSETSRTRGSLASSRNAGTGRLPISVKYSVDVFSSSMYLLDRCPLPRIGCRLCRLMWTMATFDAVSAYRRKSPHALLSNCLLQLTPVLCRDHRMRLHLRLSVCTHACQDLAL